MSPAKFLVLFVVFHLNSAVSTADDAAMGTPISCRPPPYEALPLLPPPPPPLPPPPIAEPEPLPVPVAPANCPPAIVQCCQFLPPPPPPLPPPPISEPEPLPVPVAPANCPPAIVQCCQFLPPPPPVNGNIYTPLYNESSSSFLNAGLASVLASVFWLATFSEAF